MSLAVCFLDYEENFFAEVKCCRPLFLLVLQGSRLHFVRSTHSLVKMKFFTVSSHCASGGKIDMPACSQVILQCVGVFLSLFCRSYCTEKALRAENFL